MCELSGECEPIPTSEHISVDVSEYECMYVSITMIVMYVFFSVSESDYVCVSLNVCSLCRNDNVRVSMCIC